jgi:hypothetical protein
MWRGLFSPCGQVFDMTIERWTRLEGGTRFPACEVGTNFLPIFMRSKAHATLVDWPNSAQALESPRHLKPMAFISARHAPDVRHQLSCVSWWPMTAEIG